MTRKPMVGGNWKMNLDHAACQELAADVDRGRGLLEGPCDIVFFPPHPYLRSVASHRGGCMLGAQDVSGHEAGAHTGDVSASMLVDCGCQMALVGHSERRHGHGETSREVAAKAAAALNAGLRVLLCVGETSEERAEGKTAEIVCGQFVESLTGIDFDALERIDLAYEPVWAIGTGQTASPEQAQEVHELLRAEVGSRYDARSAARMRILYGGSVTPSNAAELMACSDIDGALVGGASLEAGPFLEIVRAAART